MAQVMDRGTAEHFYAWLERVIPVDLQHDVEQGVHAVLRDHPDLLETHSWLEIARLADVW